MSNLRDAFKDLTLEKCQHPGLLFDRFYLGSVIEADGSKSEEGKSKKEHFQKVIESSNNPKVTDLYKISFHRWKDNLPKSIYKSGTFETTGRMVVGLGKASVLEIGMHLHHHLGFPYIPGSSLKGICAHYCSKVWGAKDTSFKSTMNGDKKSSGSHHQFLFGDTTVAGSISFEDAWWVPTAVAQKSQSPFNMDIITPHHEDWQDKGKAPPTDYDSPTLVSFLSISGKFHFCITWQGQDGQNAEEINEINNWMNLAWKLLTEALTEQGVGGKNSSGYGRFDLEKYKLSVEQEAKEELKKTETKKVQEELEKMTPIERNIKEFLDAHPNKDKNAKNYMKLLEELKKAQSRWTSEDDRHTVALIIKNEMIKEKKWEKKEKDAERTKFIKDILKES